MKQICCFFCTGVNLWENYPRIWERNCGRLDKRIKV